MDHIICPFCESGLLVSRGPGFARCDSCGLPLLGSALESLRDIVDLPDALGVHACECGHPEMRRLPDGVFHCPACGSEVLPANADLTMHGISRLVAEFIERLDLRCAKLRCPGTRISTPLIYLLADPSPPASPVER